MLIPARCSSPHRCLRLSNIKAIVRGVSNKSVISGWRSPVCRRPVDPQIRAGPQEK
jgi:hypothetical protein